MDAAAPGEAGLEARLVKIVRACPELMAAFRAARALDLPDWWIVSGALYGAVWNQLTGRPALQGVKDIDLFYFDPDTSWEAEDRVIRRAAPCFAAQPPVEVRNQARVHLWFEDHFGHARAPLTSARDGIDHFASATHCIGMRLRADEGFDIYAPYGLADIFALRVLPNTLLPNRATHEGKAARHKALWPELTVIPWPPEDAPRCLGPVDPALPQALALIHRSFAYMEGRIDPPSSVHRLTLAALQGQAQDGEVWGIGTPLRACAIFTPQEDALYLGKIAVDAAARGAGLARRLIEAAAERAKALSLPRLRLQSRVELTANHAAFAAMGFNEVARRAHPGYGAPTSITFEKALPEA